MPGYVMHLAVAERVIEICGIKDSKDINDLKIGSIIPDALTRSNKKQSHFWDDDIYKCFVRKPNLDMFLQKYGAYNQSRLNEPYIFGYYCHLHLDRRFIEEYWHNHFKFYDDNMEEACGFDEVRKVLLIGSGKLYDRSDFFSDKYYYGDYDIMNQYMLGKYNISTPELKLPNTEIDEVQYMSVLPELKKMLSFIKTGTKIDSQKHQITEETLSANLNVFNITDLNTLIENTSKDLAEIYQHIKPKSVKVR